MKNWNKVVFGDIFKNKKRLLARIDGIQKKLSKSFNPYLIRRRAKLWTEYEDILRREELYWAHQAKTNWLRFGDKNTKFFHQSTICRQQRNRVEALINEEGNWVYDNSEIKSLLVDFYKSLYSINQTPEETFSTTSDFPKVSESEKANIIKSVTLEEVKHALFGIGNLKSPGPDGFHVVFFKQHWEILHESLINFVNQA